MRKLVWQNANGEEINFTSGDFGITNWEGFSNAPLNIQSQQVPFQDGSVFLDALIENRELNVTLALKDNNNLEKRYELERQLIHILNPKLGEGYLIYTNDYISKRIKCIPQIPLFPNKNSNDPGTQKGELSWTACEPYWEDTEETEVTFQLGLQPIIKNEGDVPCQLEMDWYTNYVKNGRVTNVTQNQKIKYNGDLNDSLKIVTEVGKKSVTTEKMGFDVSNIGVYFRSICYSTELNLFVAVGGSGTILTSSDGVNWTSITSGVSAILYDITYSSELGLFVAVGDDGTILTSLDCVTWTVRTSGISTTLYGITYSDDLNLFVTVGGSGEILTSSDGINWTNRISSVYADLWGIVYSSELNLFVAVGGSGTILTSSDGINWTRRTIGVSVGLYGITYSTELNLFVAVGGSGTILTSSDGINWTRRTIGVSVGLYGITYSTELNLFVAVGGSGTILTSSDGVTWTSITSGVSVGLTEIIYSDELNLFVAVGNIGTILTSLDCVTWTSITSGVSTTLYGITYSDDLNLFVTVGNNGTILYSVFSLAENQIQNISADSDFGMNLGVGDNQFRINKDGGNMVVRIKYRQKYIGV